MNVKSFLAVATIALLVFGAVAIIDDVNAAEDKPINGIEYETINGVTAIYLNIGETGLTLSGTYLVDGEDGTNDGIFAPVERNSTPGIYASEVKTIEGDWNDHNIVIRLTDANGNTYTFSNEKYTITTETLNGSIEVSKERAKMGEIVNFTVKSIDGYMLKDESLSINDGSVPYATILGGYTFTMPAENVVIKAVFEKIPTYTITVEPSENGTVTASHVEAAKGATVTLTIMPDDTYALETLTVTDAQDNKIEVVDGKFVMPGSPVRVKATFTDAVRFEVTFDEDITVKNAVSGESYTSPAMIPSGTIVSVMATEKIGQVATISPALNDDGTYKITKDVEFTVTYKEKEYEDASFSGSINTITDFGENQLVTVPKDTVLQKDANISIYGKLFVPEGVTIKVSTGASLNIYGIADIQGNLEVEGADEFAEEKEPGTFLVHGNGEATISGTVNVDGVFATDVNAKIVIKSAAEVAGDIFGNIEVSEDATLTITGHVEGDES